MSKEVEFEELYEEVEKCYMKKRLLLLFKYVMSVFSIICYFLITGKIIESNFISHVVCDFWFFTYFIAPLIILIAFIILLGIIGGVITFFQSFRNWLYYGEWTSEKEQTK